MVQRPIRKSVKKASEVPCECEYCMRDKASLEKKKIMKKGSRAHDGK